MYLPAVGDRVRVLAVQRFDNHDIVGQVGTVRSIHSAYAGLPGREDTPERYVVELPADDAIAVEVEPA